jgi:hypothetical protein
MDMAEEMDFGIGNPFEAVHEGGSCQAGGLLGTCTPPI